MFRPMNLSLSTSYYFLVNDHRSIHHVSCSPSKIPYGGFSPVRLQTGIQRQPSSTRDLYAAKVSVSIPCGPCGHDSGSLSTDNPVQRSLAHLRVIVSRRVIAYYDLICA